MMKKYKIADLIVDMRVSGRTLEQAKPYEIQDDIPADITIDLDIPQILADCPRFETEDLAQYMATGTVFARRALMQFNGYYIHSSAIVLDGKAYLFTAPSGTGKSTHTEKWIRLFGAHYLNDDKPILRRVDGKWMAYGTPWSGKNDLSTNEGVPVGGIACLKRGEKNEIHPMAPAAALPYLMGQTLYHLREAAIEKKLELLNHLMVEIPIWELSCLPDDDAAYVARNAMAK
ncbi:MAG: hypothetical protein IKU57_02140 [Oscillospiraceae bacterium]|nr:hypothetical protein [Oscillospiraceae bacterium]